MNRVKSQNYIPGSGSMGGVTFQNRIRDFQRIRPRIGTSVTSKQSIKSSQSNLSYKNPFEEKVRLMRENLKLRKGNVDLINGNSANLGSNLDRKDLDSFEQVKSYVFKSEQADEYREQI